MSNDALHPDRHFSPIPAVRTVARDLYQSVRDLPLICPHGHVEAQLLAENAAFTEPTELFLTPDHYLLRMLYSQGISLASLGVPTLDSSTEVATPREAWQCFADNYHLFLGTPSRVWFEYALKEVLDVSTPFSSATAQDIYDQVLSCLREPAFRPRSLFDRFKIKVLTTTDKATDSLVHHQALTAVGLSGRVLPCFRPDALFQIASREWTQELTSLSESTGKEVASYPDFIQALEDRRSFFREHGATATDHGAETAFTERLSDKEASKLFQKALAGKANATDQHRFGAHMLMEMARMSTQDGMVMQLHAGSYRNHNQLLLDRFGTDKGADIPVSAEFTRNLRPLLNAYGNDPRFRLVLFTLDESTYSRELAPLAGHYPAVRLGPAWWFMDSMEGMTRYRRMVTETAGFFNTAGFNDDTRAFLSIPARHDLARRMDANYLAELVVKHEITPQDAHMLARALAGELATETYRLN